MNRRGFAPIIIILIVAVLLVVGGGILYFALKKPTSPLVPLVTSPPPPPASLSQPAAASTSSTSTTTIGISQSSVAPNTFQNKVAFLKGGEVWIANDDGSNPMQLSHTSGTVFYYSISPNFSYSEYYMLGHDGETDIGFMDLNNGGRITKTLKDTGSLTGSFVGEFLNADYWLSDHLVYIPKFQNVIDLRTTSTPPYPLPPTVTLGGANEAWRAVYDSSMAAATAPTTTIMDAETYYSLADNGSISQAIPPIFTVFSKMTVRIFCMFAPYFIPRIRIGGVLPTTCWNHTQGNSTF